MSTLEDEAARLISEISLGIFSPPFVASSLVPDEKLI